MCHRCENKCKPKCPCDSPKKHCKPANIDTKCTLADIEFRDGPTPSDSNTAVGIDRLVCCVNSRWSILNKQTNEVISRTDAFDFFPGLPSSVDSGASDPVVQWDEFENRFIGTLWELVNFNFDSLITVETPEGISGEYPASKSSAFVGDFDLSGVEIAPADPLNADTPLVNDLTGKIALIAADGFQTGSATKCGNALDAGAIGCIIYFDTETLGGILGSTVIPAVSTSNSIGLSLLNNQPVVGGIRNLPAEEVGQDAYSKMHICVSKDSSPNDASDFYFYEVGTIDGPYKILFADFQKIGLDTDALYISTQDDILLPNGNFNLFRHIVAVEKASLIDGTAVSPLPVLLDDLETLALDSGTYSSNSPIYIPTITHTPQINTNQVMFFVRADVPVLGATADGNALVVKTITDVLGTPVIKEFIVSVNPWVAPASYADRELSSVTQPDGIFQVEFGDPPYSLDNISAQVAYRCVQYKDSLWLTMTVGPSRNAEVRWYELDISQFFNLEESTITLKQEGKIVPDGNTSAFNPSIDVDKDGNMGIGFNISGPDQPVAIAHTGRLARDPPGTVRLPYQVNFVAQPDLPFFDFSQNFTGDVWWSRWNDYTSCILDPVDRKTFNYTCQYSNLSLDDYFAFDPQWKSGLVTFCVTEEEGKTKTKSGQKCSVVKTKVTEPLKVQSRKLSSKQTEEASKLSKMTKEECVCHRKELGQKKANAEFLRKGRKVKIGKFKPLF